MENQGKRLLLAVGLALAVMMLFQLVWGKKDEKKPAAGSGSQIVGTATGTTRPTAPPIATTPEAPRGPEENIVLEYPGKLTATFSNYGGALVSWRLADAKFEKDASTQHKGELLPTRAGTGAFYVDFRSSDLRLPPNVEWKGTRVSDTEVRYTLSVDKFDIEKTFVVVPEAYVVKMSLKVAIRVPAGTVATQSLVVSSFAFQDPKAKLEGRQQVEARIWSSASMRGGEVRSSNIKDLIEAARKETGVTWAGFDHPYMLQAFSPRPLPNEVFDKYAYAIGDEGLMRSDLVFPPIVYKTGDEPITREVVGYLGPKSYHALDAADSTAGFHAGFADTIDFGWFGVIGRPLLWLLLKFFSFLGNWGVAIMLLTVLVKLATLYWTTKSMRSMKAMAALGPQMKALQEKYKDDKQRQQAETMALYKQHNVNPIAGCLPIFLQMPIWIALYRMLSNAGELYQAPFISGWINDLTATDPYHILPIVLVVTMFAQARMTPSTGDSRQQKFIQYGMPLMFGVMSFFFPSGLTLYIFTNTCLSALHSIYMNKFDKKSLVTVAAMKKNAEEAAKKAAGPVKGAKAAKAAKPVIDATATETETDASDDEGSAKPTGSPNQARGNRPKRKKKKR